MDYTVFTGKKKLIFRYERMRYKNLSGVITDIRKAAKLKPTPNSLRDEWNLYDAEWRQVYDLRSFERAAMKTLYLEPSDTGSKLPSISTNSLSASYNRSTPGASHSKFPSLSPTSRPRANSDSVIRSRKKKKTRSPSKKMRQTLSVDRNNNTSNNNNSYNASGAANRDKSPMRARPPRNNQYNNRNLLHMSNEADKAGMRNIRKISGNTQRSRVAKRKSRERKKIESEPESKSAEDEDMDSLNEGVIYKSKFVIPIDNKSELTARYKFDQVIGDGNFAVVSKCFDRRDSTSWAIKEIEKKNVKGKVYYIENEADLMLRCKHVNICRLKEAFQSPTAYFLVLELLECGDLFDAIKSTGTFAESVTAAVLFDVANALQYLHHYKIVHRDIKPENLLLNSDFRVKLADFGLACKVMGKLYRVCGTPTYVAPEILSEEGYGLLVDIWSLGVIGHIMLVGYAPFRSSNREELFELIQEGNYSYDMPGWEGVTQGAKDLLSKLLQVKPEQRLSAKHLLRDHWLRRKTQGKALSNEEDYDSTFS